jgi:hypothetical protein
MKRRHLRAFGLKQINGHETLAGIDEAGRRPPRSRKARKEPRRKPARKLARKPPDECRAAAKNHG